MTRFGPECATHGPYSGFKPEGCPLCAIETNAQAIADLAVRMREKSSITLRIAREAVESARETGCESHGAANCFDTWPDSPDDLCRSCAILGMYLQASEDEQRILDDYKP